MSSCHFGRIAIPVILVLIFFLCTMPVMAGDELEVWGFVKPEGSLEPGEKINCSYTVQYTFDSDAESIEFYTDLSDAVWQFSTLMDGARQVMPKRFGRYETITGFELYYPRVYQTFIEVKLNGIVPSVVSTGNYSIFSVTHYDAGGNIKYSEKVERTFLNPSELGGVQNTMEAKLSNLRSEIDGLYLQGVDTSSAEEKYSDASDAISSAKYSSPSVQSSLLSSADVYIDESRTILNISWAKHSIDVAEKKINSVDSIVTYFESSKGISDDSRVWVIKSYNDNAKTLLVLAEDKFSNSDYMATRNYASQAEGKADEAYSYVLSLDDELNLGAPVQTEIWANPTPKVTYTPVVSSVISVGSIGETDLKTEGLDDIDTLLHSDVDVESTLKIAAKIADLLLAAFDFLNDLIISASNN